MPLWIPLEQWSGNAVLDFEQWSTVWELNHDSGGFHSRLYQNVSRQLVRVKHPDFSAAQVEAQARPARIRFLCASVCAAPTLNAAGPSRVTYIAAVRAALSHGQEERGLKSAQKRRAQAKQEFEAAATLWFITCLETCKQMRPHAKWGFYGLPRGNAPAEYGQRQMPIFLASDAIFPSIYDTTTCSGGAAEHEAQLTFTRKLISESKARLDLAIQEGTQVLFSLWDSLMFRRVPKKVLEYPFVLRRRPWPARSSPCSPAGPALCQSTQSCPKSVRPVRSTIRVPLFAARTLNATGESRATLSLRQERLRAACGPRQEERGPEIRGPKNKTTPAGRSAANP